MGNELDLFDVESIKDEIKEEENMKEEEMTMPAYGSEEWNDYVMSKFKDNEQFDGNPTCAGLRRVVDEVLGTVVSSRPTQVFPASDPNGPGRATVVFEVVIDWMDSGQYRTFADVADVWHGNTDDLFCAHPVATASTRAEGRALRKALKIKCLAAEELAKKDIASIVRQTVQQKPTDGEWKEEDNISSAQMNFIGAKCEQLDINVMNFINCGSESYGAIGEVSKKTASKMLGLLNEYQTKTKETPEDIKGYDSNWR
tara:strand:- start:242 stop:1009 length:768 start_codon:yes stop_codon:yes gene_type:complete